MRQVATEKGQTLYLNSGDWVENLTALEYNDGSWSVYRYHEDKVAQSLKLNKRFVDNLDNDLIFKDLVTRFLTVKA